MRVLLILFSALFMLWPFSGYLIAQEALAYETLWNSIFHLDQEATIYVSVSDFNGDGYTDLLLGYGSDYTLEKTPLILLTNNGDGTFREATEDYIIGDLRAANPVGVTADFNSDGILDVAIFDAGNLERGQDPVETGFYGEEPILLLSDKDNSFIISSALAEAEKVADPNRNGKLHVKFAYAGDIDNDGHIDIFVESAGGTNRIAHFLMNNGDGSFIADSLITGRVDEFLKSGPDGIWRNFAHQLYDMNGDGFLDLIFGQGRWNDGNRDEQASRVAYNDGNGRFKAENSTKLPHANWYDGWTGVGAITPFNLNEDGLMDLILYHFRSSEDSNPALDYTGLYLQFLINNGDETFYDATETYIGDQSATTVSQSDLYGNNGNLSKLQLVDMNSDGYLDLVTVAQQTPVGHHAPFVFINNGSNFFTAIDPDLITKGESWFAENAFPIHLNQDDLIDLVHLDLAGPGPDGVYGTGDETTDIISMLAINENLSVEMSIENSNVYFISQNYPNPFNGETSIRFGLSNPAYVNIEIYNMIGYKIRTLVAGHKNAGVHTVTWNGRNGSGNNVASGLYIYVINMRQFHRSKKLLLH